MIFAISLLGVVLFVVGTLLGARASRRLLVLHVKNGLIYRAKGRAPAELLHDIEDITERAGAQGKIEILVENGSAAVRTSAGWDAGVVQRLRNAVGRFPIAKLRAAPTVENRSPR